MMASKSQTKGKVSAMSKKQKYAEILDDSEAIQCIREWLLEHRNGFKSPTSAHRLAKQLGYPELNRELVVLREIRFDDDASFSECVLKGLKKRGVRKKLLPALAAKVFGRDPSEVFNRLISFSDLERTLRGVSAPVEAVAKPLSSDGSSVEDQAEALFSAMDSLFMALEAMDRERHLVLLRIVCVLHLIFEWSAQVNADCEITEQVSRRFFDCLGIPDSERSLSRLRLGVATIVSGILPGEQPISVLIPEFEEWWRSLFLEIDMRGTEFLEELTPELRQLPGNPFRLAYDCSVAGEPEDLGKQENLGEQKDVSKENVAEEHGDDPASVYVGEGRALNDLDSGGTIEEVEIVDPIDRATSEAEMLKSAPQSERSKIVRKYFAKLAKQVTPLEYDHYKGLPISELRTLLFEAKVVQSRIGDICSMVENEISRRESPASDSGEDI